MRTLEDLKRCMEALGVPYAIIGGIAVVLNGYLRSTVDVDALAEIDFTRIEEFMQTVGYYGFEARVTDAVAFARRNYVLLLRHRETGLPVDLSFAFTPYEQEAISRAHIIDLEMTKVPVATPEDLLIMKCVAQRPVDLVDISELYRRYADQVDLDRVRYWVEQFGEALEEPDLWTRVEPLLQRE